MFFGFVSSFLVNKSLLFPLLLFISAGFFLSFFSSSLSGPYRNEEEASLPSRLYLCKDLFMWKEKVEAREERKRREESIVQKEKIDAFRNPYKLKNFSSHFLPGYDPSRRHTHATLPKPTNNKRLPLFHLLVSLFLLPALFTRVFLFLGLLFIISLQIDCFLSFFLIHLSFHLLLLPGLSPSFLLFLFFFFLRL